MFEVLKGNDRIPNVDREKLMSITNTGKILDGSTINTEGSLYRIWRNVSLDIATETEWNRIQEQMILKMTKIIFKVLARRKFPSQCYFLWLSL
jgi:hypothetical protein